MTIRLDTLPTQPKDISQEGEQPSPLPQAKRGQINLGALPHQPPPVEVPVLTAAPEGKTIAVTLTPSQRAVFDKQVELFTNELVVGVYGQPYLDEMKEAIKNQTFFVTRAPRAVMATVAPFYSLAFEVLDQGKNLLVSAIEGDEFDFREQRMLSEIIPEEAPTALKVSASLGETLIDVALVGGAINLAKEGTLTETLKTMVSKLDKAGFDVSKHKFTRSQIVKAAKGTSLEDAMKLFIKVKKTDPRIRPGRQRSAGKSTIKAPVTGKELEVVRPAAVEKPIEIPIDGPKAPKPPGEEISLIIKPFTLEERAAKAKTAAAFITAEEKRLKEDMKGVDVSLSGDTKRQLINVFNKAHADKPPVSEVVTKLTKMPNFKKPTPIVSLLTSQTRYADLLGVGSLVQPLVVGKVEFDMELRAIYNEIAKVEQVLKKAGTTTPPAMARLLNKFEEAPEKLNEVDRAVFQYARELGRDLLRRENEVRAKTGRPPIKGINAYFRHIARRTAQEIRAGEVKVPPGLQEWAEKNVKSKTFNPTELQRKYEDAVLAQFSDDFGFVLRAMTRTALREIHMDSPLKFFNEELKRVEGALPAETKKWVVDFVNQVLEGQQNYIDAGFNRLITDGPIAPFLDKILKQFGKQLSARPYTELMSGVSQLPIYGTLGGLRPKILLRNKMQTVQNIALYGIENTWKGLLPTSDFPLLEKLKTASLFLRSYSGIEDMPAELVDILKKWGLAPYQWSAVSNVNQAMNAAFHWTMSLVQDPAAKKYGWASPLRTYTEDKNFAYPDEIERITKEMEYGAHTAQYQYLAMAMPEVFRYKALAPFTRLQSWWMNHFFVFHREAITRTFWGHTGYDPSLLIPGRDRVNYLKYLMLGGALLTGLGYKASFGTGVLPSGLPPTGQVMLGLYNLATNQGDEGFQKRKRTEAVRDIMNALPAHIPFFLSLKETYELVSGKKNLWDYITYNKPEKKTGASLF